jgi:DNA-binding NtrC family response regulator
VLRDGEVVIMDEGTRVELDHRVIAAVDRSLDVAVTDGQILSDLRRRLAGCCVEVPSLRDRRDDIPVLAAHFVKVACERANIPPKTLSKAATSLLSALPWKGNARELRAVLEIFVTRVHGETIDLEDVLAHVHLDGRANLFEFGGTLKQARARFEADYINAVVAQHHGASPKPPSRSESAQ